MTFSWKELVCHGLLKEIGEPSLVTELLEMVMKERWLFLEEEARKFHSGLDVNVLNYFRVRRKRQALHEMSLYWRERLPEERRQAETRHKESKLLRWRGQGVYDIHI